VMTVTVLPPRCAFCRMISTRPRFLGGTGDSTASGRDSGAGGRPAPLRPAKGLGMAAGPPCIEIGLLFMAANIYQLAVPIASKCARGATPPSRPLTAVPVRRCSQGRA
jgi:hypothetical protein